jgi:chromosome segregation ATPase
VKNNRDLLTNPLHDSPELELPWLEHELAEARATIRQLHRQIEKEQARYGEISRAYKLTVENIVELARENTELERDRDLWRARASSGAAGPGLDAITLTLTADEISAIRRAIARLHHPDTGGDAKRMQLWNAALDALEP